MTLENTLSVTSRSSADNVPARRRIRVDGGKQGIARIDGRRRAARRVNELITQYSERLGGRVEPDRIRRAAELVAIAEDLRGAKLRGERIDGSEMFKAEGYADRALRALGLGRPHGKPRTLPPLADMVAAVQENERTSGCGKSKAGALVR